MHSSGGVGSETAMLADYASLARLAAHLRALGDVLADPNAALPAIGMDPEVAAAIERAEHDWHAQRRRVSSFLADAAGGADAAAQAYRRTDLDIARAGTPGRGGGHGRPRAD